MKSYYEKGQLVWLAPGAVSYRRNELSILLPYLFHMRHGFWPLQPPSSGYVGGSKPGIRAVANFVGACMVAAEIDSRLAHCGFDRLVVEDFYCKCQSVSAIARYYHKDEDEITKKFNSAMSYISSGPCPMYAVCEDCLKYDTCQNHRPAVSYEEWKARHYRQAIAAR